MLPWGYTVPSPAPTRSRGSPKKCRKAAISPCPPSHGRWHSHRIPLIQPYAQQLLLELLLRQVCLIFLKPELPA